MSRRRHRRRTGRRRRRRRALGALQRADVQRLRAAPPQGVRWQVSRTRLSPGGRANRTASIPMRFNARRGEAKTPRAGAREGLLRASRRGACGARRVAASNFGGRNIRQGRGFFFPRLGGHFLLIWPQQRLLKQVEQRLLKQVERCSSGRATTRAYQRAWGSVADDRQT